MIGNKFAENFSLICKPKDKSDVEQLKDIQSFYERLDYYESSIDMFDNLLDSNKIQDHHSCPAIG